MADKEMLYRIEFEGAKEQLAGLAKIRAELDEISDLQDKASKDDKVRVEELKVASKQKQDQYRKEQQAIKDQANAQKAVAGSLEDLRIKARQYTKELEKLPIGTKEFANQANKVELVNRQIRNADKSAGNFKTNIGNYAGSIGDAFQGIGLNVGKLTGTLGAATAAGGPLGLALVGVAGAAQLFGSALQTTDTLADKFAETMASAKAATSVFFTALATGDFSNFFTNIREAIREGKEYAQVMDKIEDQRRSRLILEEEDRGRVLDLMTNLRNVNLSLDERKNAAKEIIKIENDNAEKNAALSKKALDAEINLASVTKGINKEKIYDIIRNIDAYQSQFNILDKVKSLQDEISKTTDPKIRFGLQMQLDSVKALTASYSADLLAFANLNEERQKITDLGLQYEKDKNAAKEKLQRTETRYNSLIAEGIKATTVAVNNEGKAVKSLNAELEKMLPSLSQLIKMAEEMDLTDKRDTSAYRKIFAERFAPEEEQNVPDDSPEYVARTGVDIQAVTSAASQFVSVWVDAYAMKDEALKQSLEKGLISEKQYTEESAKLQKKANNLQRLSVIAQLSGDLAKTLSALGVGAANTAKVGFPLNVPLLIAFAAQAVGILSNLKSIKFADGGLIAGGKPHSQGGTKYVGSDGSAFEAERGEYIAVVNKHDTKRLGELSNLNSRHGRSFYGQPNAAYFAQGGIFSPNQNIGNNQQESMIRAMVNQIGSIPVEVSLNEIEKKSDLKRKVNTIGSL